LIIGRNIDARGDRSLSVDIDLNPWKKKAGLAQAASGFSLVGGLRPGRHQWRLLTMKCRVSFSRSHGRKSVVVGKNNQ